MCGIAGVILKHGSQAGDRLQRMIPMLQHRGPDETGVHLDQGCAFANMRLAIVDRAHGGQPIYSKDHRVGIVYNGEVYNFPELRSELTRKGAAFVSNSDTEVILRAYEYWGTSSFDRLNGMFAYCLWDKAEDAVYLVRDHLGIKPLYVYEDDHCIAFASELKALVSLPELDLSLSPEGILDYLQYRYTQAPYTIFRRIRRLEAGSYMRITDTGSVCVRYWEPTFCDTPLDRTLEDAAEELQGLLRDAVRSQLMGEVPIGVLLSGGLDSSAIAYMVNELGANLRTYNIGFPDLNEFAFSREVAEEFGLEHIEVTTTPEQLAADFDKVVLALDEPLGDSACLPLYELCRSLKQDVTVVLSGEGGDELFAGYPQYIPIEPHRGLPPEERFRQFLVDSSYRPDAARYLQPALSRSGIVTAPWRNRSAFLEQPTLNGMLAFDQRTWLPDNLMMKADKILMAHALEGRFPFLDRRIVEFANRLPSIFKQPGDEKGKAVLRAAMRNKLPVSVLERPKMGFTVPRGEILFAMKNHVLDTFRALERTEVSDLFQTGEWTREAERFFQRRSTDPLPIWTQFVFAKWFTYSLPSFRRASLADACPGRVHAVVRSHADRIRFTGGEHEKSIDA